MTTQPQIRVGPLSTVRQIAHELSRLYKQARRKAGPDIGSAEAYRLASILSVMAKCLETSEFERHRGDGSCNYSARERRALPAEGGRVNSASILKRLEQLEQTIRFRHPRIIVLTVPTDASTG